MKKNAKRCNGVLPIQKKCLTLLHEQITVQKTIEIMSQAEVLQILLPPMYNAALRAGAAIMAIHGCRDDYQITLKNDHTPITMADREAHRIIRETLGSTRIPILSEEGREMLYDERRNWELYFLVDPLDGTTEFIEGYNEFTVNIALMSENRCVGAVVYVPYFEKIYLAGEGAGAFMKEGVAVDSAAAFTYEELFAGARQLPLEPMRQHAHFKVAVSRLHCTDETLAHIDTLRAEHPDLEVVMQGSSYKFCMLAEGVVDYYVRTSPTYEWDTAAGELILAEAGGKTRVLGEERQLRYNEVDLRNPWFYCCSKFSNKL